MEPIRCFLVDDDTDEHEIFEIALSEIKGFFEFISSTSSTEAVKSLRLYESETPDYIFLDLNMPNLNGKECLVELRSVEHLKEIPIVIYSTSSSEEDVQECRTLGATHYIIKPTMIDDLVRMLSTIFNNLDLPFLIKNEKDNV